MPLSADKKEKVLCNLRRSHNHTDQKMIESDRSLEFSEQVRSDVQEIVENQQNQNVVNWGKTISQFRTKKRITLCEVAHKLGVCHKTIQLQESKNDPATVDPFFLEAFSLVYHMYPYELLNLPPKHPVNPFLSPNDKNSKYSNVIINTLWDGENPNKLSLLKAITTIGRLTDERYDYFMSFLSETRSFKNVLKIDPLDCKAADDHSWREFFRPVVGKVDDRNSDLYQTTYTLWEAFLVIDWLEKFDSVRLDNLARLSLCDEECAKKLVYLVLEIGYPKDPKSLRNYDVDSLALKFSDPPTGKRTRPYDAW